MIRNCWRCCRLLLPVPAAAGALSDLLMAPGVFDDAPAGSVVAYGEDARGARRARR